MTGYRIQIPPTTELHRREIELRVRQMSDFYREMGLKETWFNTREDILVYLNDIVGVRTEWGKRVTMHTLRRWHKKAAFPMYRPHLGRTYCATSNVHVMVWLWAFRVYKALKPHHPNTKDLADATAHLTCDGTAHCI